MAGKEGGREEGREAGGREGGGGYQSAQKISRVSSQSDENILNANGGKLPRVKLNSGQELKKNVQRGEGEFSPNCACMFYPPVISISYAEVTCAELVLIGGSPGNTFYFLNANNLH